MERTIAGFAGISPQLGAFAEMVRRDQLSDLMTRSGRRGGYCTFLPTLGPFVFANFNGTRDDVRTLIRARARFNPGAAGVSLLDYVWPTMKAPRSIRWAWVARAGPRWTASSATAPPGIAAHT